MKNKVEILIEELEGHLRGNQRALKHLQQLKEVVKPMPKDNYKYRLYTDGACRGNPGPGAWAALGLDQEAETLFELSGVEMSTTNNRMELMAVIQVLKEYDNYFDEKERNASFAVYSDSNYVVQGMNSWVKGWIKRGWKKADNSAPENVDLWKELDNWRNKFPNISFNWVKGHAGDTYNERCDQLANLALDDAGL